MPRGAFVFTDAVSTIRGHYPKIDLFFKDSKCHKFLEFTANADSIPIGSYRAWQASAAEHSMYGGEPFVIYLEHPLNRDSLLEPWLCDCDTGSMKPTSTVWAWIPNSGSIKVTRTKLDTIGNVASCRVSAILEDIVFNNDNLSIPNVKLANFQFDSLTIRIRL